MPLDGAVAEEQLLADLGVGEPVKGQPGYLRFLRREGITGVFGALADGFARGQEFALRPVGGRMGTHRIERRVGRFQLGTRIDTAVFTSKPLAVDELRARVVDDDARPSKLLDRLQIQLLGTRSMCEQRTRAGLDAARQWLSLTENRSTSRSLRPSDPSGSR